MATVLACHRSFLLTNLMIVRVQRSGLPLGQVALLDLIVDARALVGEATVYLLAARMIFLLLRVRERGAGRTDESGT